MNTTPTLTIVPSFRDGEKRPAAQEIERVIRFFETADLAQKLTFNAREVVTDEGVTIHEFTALVSARFIKNGQLHIVLNTGDVVNITESFNSLI